MPISNLKANIGLPACCSRSLSIDVYVNLFHLRPPSDPRPNLWRASLNTGDKTAGTTYTISQLAREFDVTTRAIRFYEDQGLLIPERVGRRDEVEGPGLGDRLALLEGDEPGELVVGLAEDLEEVREVLLALLVAPRAPVQERLPRRGDGGVDLRRPGPVDLGEAFPAGGAAGEEGAAGLDVEAVDDRPGRDREALLQIIAPRVIFSTCLR